MTTVESINGKERTQEKLQNQEKRVSDYKEEILKHKRVLLNAPMGSGKTYFTINLLPTLGKTLFITSRSIIKESSTNNAITYFNSCISEFSNYENITIWHQWDIKNREYDINDYKYVVIDEIHAISADATFTDACFYIGLLIKDLPEDITLIMTSACADRVQDFITNILKVPVTYIDLYGLVKEVKPKSIDKVVAKQAYDKLYKADENNKILYFCEKTKRAYELEEELKRKGKRVIAITSKPENRVIDKKDNKESYYFEKLAHEEMFPSDIDIIITTSKLREGLNLYGNNIKAVITELKDWVSLIQCAGRVREGVCEYLIVMDKGNHAPYYDIDKLKTVDDYIRQINNAIDPSKLDGDEVSQIVLETINTGIDTVYGNLAIYHNGKYYKNEAMIYEIEQRWAEYSSMRKDMDLYLEKYITTDNKQVIFDGIVQNYIGEKLSPQKAKAVVDELNKANFIGKSLDPMVSRYGYNLNKAANYSWYCIQN